MPDTKITRLKYKQVFDKESLFQLLDEEIIAYIAFNDHESPMVFPSGFARVDDTLIIHGSTGSPWINKISRENNDVAICVTKLEALSVARSAFESSFRYRSAIIYGNFRLVNDKDEKFHLLNLLTEKFIPGRTNEIRSNGNKELAATQVLQLLIKDDNWSLKHSKGWPEDSQEDLNTDVWAGLVPINWNYSPPISHPDLSAGIKIPKSVENLINRNS